MGWAREAVGWGSPGGAGEAGSSANGLMGPSRLGSGSRSGSDSGGVDFSAVKLGVQQVSGKCRESKKCRKVTPLLSVAKPFDASAAAPAFHAWSAFPDDAFWVNLHPHEPGRLIDPGLQATNTGRVLLQADLQLKKTAAALLHPDTDLGERFWNAVYDRAGLRDSKLCYSLRQWITPGRVEVLEAGDAVHIAAAQLEVHHEGQFTAAAGAGAGAGAARESEEMAAEACRGVDPDVRAFAEALYADLVLPELTRAVNTEAEYAELRRAYYWRLVWEWARERGHFAGAVAANLGGDPARQDPVRAAGWNTARLFEEYLTSVGEGEFHIRREVSVGGARLLRTYYHGGVDFRRVPTLTVTELF